MQPYIYIYIDKVNIIMSPFSLIGFLSFSETQCFPTKPPQHWDGWNHRQAAMEQCKMCICWDVLYMCVCVCIYLWSLGPTTRTLSFSLFPHEFVLDKTFTWETPPLPPLPDAATTITYPFYKYPSFLSTNIDNHFIYYTHTHTIYICIYISYLKVVHI